MLFSLLLFLVPFLVLVLVLDPVPVLDLFTVTVPDQSWSQSLVPALVLVNIFGPVTQCIVIINYTNIQKQKYTFML